LKQKKQNPLFTAKAQRTQRKPREKLDRINRIDRMKNKLLPLRRGGWEGWFHRQDAENAWRKNPSPL